MFFVHPLELYIISSKLLQNKLGLYNSVFKIFHFFHYFRGGVLEPAGTVEIKFRKKDLVKAMRRLDDKYNSLSQTLAAPGENYNDRYKTRMINDL